MARAKPPEGGRRRSKPATTSEEREDQIVAMAYDLAEEQILDGTASSQVVTHFLKLGSSREKIEQERLRGEVKLAAAKIEAMESAAKMEDLYGKAILAMSVYQGKEPPQDAEPDEE